MHSQCPICGRPVETAARCARCRSEQRTRLLIISVIALAIIGVAGLALLVYIALAPAPASRAEQANPAVSPAAAPITSPLPSPSPSPVMPATNIAALTRYSEAVQPQLAAMHGEMAQVALDIRQFLKHANASQGQRETLRVLEDFREQLKNHEMRLTEISTALGALSAPAELQQEHTNLHGGVKKYLAAVQSYITGVAARSFPQIRASQADLEAAEREIRTSADDFQQRLRKLINAS